MQEHPDIAPGNKEVKFEYLYFSFRKWAKHSKITLRGFRKFFEGTEFKFKRRDDRPHILLSLYIHLTDEEKIEARTLVHEASQRQKQKLQSKRKISGTKKGSKSN